MILGVRVHVLKFWPEVPTCGQYYKGTWSLGPGSHWVYGFMDLGFLGSGFIGFRIFIYRVKVQGKYRI